MISKVLHSRASLFAAFCLSMYILYRLSPVGSDDQGQIMTFTYVPRNRTTIGIITNIERIALANYALPKILDELSPENVQEMSRRARLFSQLHPIPTMTVTGELGRLLEKSLYGYVLDKYGSVTSLARSFVGGGRGVVITTGDLYFQFAVHLIRSLRYLGCHLPVEIWYNGARDLNSTNVDFIKSFHNVRLQNIQAKFSVHMETWDIKPFAVLASSFEEVILMDADTVFVKNPELLFDDIGYKSDGALFFNDRSLFAGQGEKSQWILSLFPEPHSKRIQNLRMLQAKSQYELEAGCLVIDKRRHFHGLLAVGWLNCPGQIKDIIREETHGEKETFWIGLEMLNEPYAFMPNLPGALGAVLYNENDRVQELCGKLAHFGRDGRLLWFNDAIAASKLPEDYYFMNVLAELTHYALESEGEWELLCLRKCQFHELPKQELDIINSLKTIYRYNPASRKQQELPE